jgi:polysaccharide export outer membrane protein
MMRWDQILMVLGAMTFGVMVVAVSDAGAEGFGSPFGKSAAPQAKRGDGFTPAPSKARSAPRSGNASAAGSATATGYEIGPTDVLEISVFGVPELSGTLIVADNGTIQLPLIGETPAAGKTARELQLELAKKWGEEYLQNPQVMVVVKEFNSRSVVLTGAINQPGVYPLKGRTSLLELVAMGGGFDESSDSTVVVLRKSGGKRKAARFDVSAIERGRANDPIMQPGDTVVAGTSAIKSAYRGLLKALPVAGLFALF